MSEKSLVPRPTSSVGNNPRDAGRGTGDAGRRSDRRTAWLLVAPALSVIVLIGIFPLAWTAWESLHRHDLRMPWLGKPFVGVKQYISLARDARFWSAMGHTAFFTVTSVLLELLIGLFLALVMNRAFRGRGAVRAAILVPWAIPTVVAALLWRFLFESPGGLVNLVLIRAGILTEPIVWLVQARTAWVPLILADVWKTTPFVALLLLAGLQTIPRELYESAAVDGAGRFRQLWTITLPLLKPMILVALIFRTVDAFRVFDLVYVMTGGGPGTSTEPIALYVYSTLFQFLRFGYGSALSMTIFVVTFALALIYIRLLGGAAGEEQ